MAAARAECCSFTDPNSAIRPGGYTLSRTRLLDIPIADGEGVRSRFFSARSVERTEQLIYWTRIGQSFPQSWLGQRAAVMRSNLAGEIPDGVLVRISTINADEDAAIETMRRFGAMMVAQAPARGRQMLLGRSTV